MAPLPVQGMFRGIQKMKHHIRTSFGISKNFYGEDRWLLDKEQTHQPPSGVGQGNGDGPTTWIMVSTPIINMVRDAGFGTTVASPISLHKPGVRFAGYMFIDDLDMIHSKTRTKPEALISEAQEMINTYSGGAPLANVSGPC